jgi:uncharacterized membrane protein YgdD (TMEM256/DUF423 family)
MNERSCLAAGGLAMFAAVAAGAFGAHALKSALRPDLLAVWHTAVQYQAWHALALLAVGLLMARSASLPDRPDSRLRAAAWLFLIGIVIFSGSLYLLALTGERRLGAVTPLGGVAFLAGWLTFAWAALRPDP